MSNAYDLSAWDPDSPAEFDGVFSDATGLLLRERFRTLAPLTVAEVGCATGRMTAQLTAPGRRVLATDLDEAMLVRGRGRGLRGVEFVHGDVLDWESMEFEAIVCCSVLHEAVLPAMILRKCHELLAPDGRLFVTVPSANSIHRLPESAMSERARRFGVRREISIGEWHNELISGTGLRVVERYEFFLKPFENARMACLSVPAVQHLSRYRGPGGAICFFELARA